MRGAELQNVELEGDDRAESSLLLGTGKRIFAEGTPARAFELASTTATPTGIVINSYKPTGPLKNQP
jgi:hypothetical protein